MKVFLALFALLGISFAGRCGPDSKVEWCPCGGETPHTSSCPSTCGYMFRIKGEQPPRPPRHHPKEVPCDPWKGTHIRRCVDMALYTSLAMGQAAAKKGRIVGSAGTFAKERETGAFSNIDVQGHEITASVMATSTFQQNITCVACMNCAPPEEFQRDEKNSYTIVGIEHDCQEFLDIAVVDCFSTSYCLRYNYKGEGIFQLEDPSTYPWAPLILRTICIDDIAGYVVVSTCFDQQSHKKTPGADELVFAFSNKPADTKPEGQCYCAEDPAQSLDTNFAAILSCVRANFKDDSMVPEKCGPTWTSKC